MKEHLCLERIYQSLLKIEISVSSELAKVSIVCSFCNVSSHGLFSWLQSMKNYCLITSKHA